jgi:hypothetical protein
LNCTVDGHVIDIENLKSITKVNAVDIGNLQKANARLVAEAEEKEHLQYFRVLLREALSAYKILIIEPTIKSAFLDQKLSKRTISEQLKNVALIEKAKVLKALPKGHRAKAGLTVLDVSHISQEDRARIAKNLKRLDALLIPQYGVVTRDVIKLSAELNTVYHAGTGTRTTEELRLFLATADAVDPTAAVPKDEVEMFKKMREALRMKSIQHEAEFVHAPAVDGLEE